MDAGCGVDSWSASNRPVVIRGRARGERESECAVRLAPVGPKHWWAHGVMDHGALALERWSRQSKG
jgi:hypothetical protein